jgi:hypothetical protein
MTNTLVSRVLLNDRGRDLKPKKAIGLSWQIARDGGHSFPGCDHLELLKTENRRYCSDGLEQRRSTGFPEPLVPYRTSNVRGFLEPDDSVETCNVRPFRLSSPKAMKQCAGSIAGCPYDNIVLQCHSEKPAGACPERSEGTFQMLHPST